VKKDSAQPKHIAPFDGKKKIGKNKRVNSSKDSLRFIRRKKESEFIKDYFFERLLYKSPRRVINIAITISGAY
jgi:hypothetical protein